MSMTYRAALAKVEENFYTEEMEPQELAQKIDYLMYQDHKPEALKVLNPAPVNHGMLDPGYAHDPYHLR